VRLTEIAQNVGTPAILDRRRDRLDIAWFPTGKETVLVTAGASAPENLVAEVCRTLLTASAARSSSAMSSKRTSSSRLPATLRRMMTEKGIDSGTARIRVGQAPTSRRTCTARFL
jgi:4-hydroxy-3-methylbut-2-enyl diphosphate reductase